MAPSARTKTATDFIGRRHDVDRWELARDLAKLGEHAWKRIAYSFPAGIGGRDIYGYSEHRGTRDVELDLGRSGLNNGNGLPCSHGRTEFPDL